MWYNVDFSRLAFQMLPTALRTRAITAFTQLIIKPINTLYYDIWKLWREKNIYKLEHTGQVCYLRKALNDNFDTQLRRIYLGDGNLYDTTYIYTEVEPQNVYLNTEAETGTLWLRTEAETADTGLDFIVYVPQEIYNLNLYGLHALIKFYKAGGKRYDILTIN